jgi:5'-nucleotidase
MVFPIERKLVVAVSSSALFDLTESDRVWTEDGPRVYERYQREHLDDVLGKGVGFPFIRRFLNINSRFPQEQPVEVVLLSRNSATTGRRVFRSIAHYGLGITRAAFMDGKSPFEYIPAFNASLFLSANPRDVLNAIQANHPAGTVLKSAVVDNPEDNELRIAFDFDGVVVDDESETVYQQQSLDIYFDHEMSRAHVPHKPGPLADFLKKLSFMQKLEIKEAERNRDYKRVLRIAIISARNAPAHERMVNTLEEWGISPNETFLLGGVSKGRILDVMRPHVFFDDQVTHLRSGSVGVPMVHVPFGIANTSSST